MQVDITVKIGGEAGQGIQTVGDLLALVCQQAGLYIMAINDYESRIRGGHSFFQVRIANHYIAAPHHQVHLLVAMNRRTIDLHGSEMAEGGLIMTDSTGDLTEAPVVIVPISELAQAAGGKINANTVAAGACLSLLGAPLELYQTVLKQHFGKKSQQVIADNLKAAELGYNAVKNQSFKWAFQWEQGQVKGRIMGGSKAVALGAVAADCRFGAFYPMSPATGVMAELNAYSDRLPIVVEQAEDEIAAINMIVGASFAGVRSMTSTSGGGFCLMTEGLGLAAMSETPIVIVNGQRPGPATGMPTRTAQGDLLFAIRASQDEFPRFVFAPGSVTEAFETTVRAFDLADKYQVPAIILTDHYLNGSVWINDHRLTVPEKIQRYLVSEAEMENPSEYKRFALTGSGVSPRALPCLGKALVISTGNEHHEDGHISEDSHDRFIMMNKRNAKLKHMEAEMRAPGGYHPTAETLLIGWGSTKGAICEAVDQLRQDGFDVGGLIFEDIWPFPAGAAETALKQSKRFFMVESNSTAQLGSLIREQTGLKYTGTVLKYDGRPFYPIEIVNSIKAILEQHNG